MKKFAPLILFLFITTAKNSFSQASEDLTSPLMMEFGGKKAGEKSMNLVDSRRESSSEKSQENASSLSSRGDVMPYIKEGGIAEQIILEDIKLKKFLEQIKNGIEPEVQAQLVEAIKDNKLNSNPFSAGIAWRRVIKDTPLSQDQLREQQEDYVKKTLRAVQETYCKVYHLPYRLDTEGRVEVLPKKDRIEALLKKATDAAQGIKEDSLEAYAHLVRTFLESFFPATPSAEELVENLKKTNSIQEKIKILNAVKAKNFSIDSNLEVLQNNLEKKRELSSSLARLIQLERERSKLAEKVLDEKTVPRLRDFEFFSDPDNEDLKLNTKRQAALNRIQKLAPLSDISEKLQQGTIPIDYKTLTDLVGATPFDQDLLLTKRASIEEAQADLKREIFQYLCHDLAFKFNQAYYEVAAISKNQPEMLPDENSQSQIKPLAILEEKLRYMTLFLEVLSSGYEKIEKNRGDLETIPYKFLREVTNSIQNINSALTGKYANYQRAEQNVVLPGHSELDFFNKISEVSPLVGSLRELQRGTMNQNNSQAFYYHLLAARFLIHGVYANNVSDTRLPPGAAGHRHEKLIRIGDIFALAACRKEWEDNPNQLTAKEKRIFDKDDWSSQEYANLAEALRSDAKSNLFNVLYYDGCWAKTFFSGSTEEANDWKVVITIHKDGNKFQCSKSGSFDFYKTKLAEKFLYNLLKTGGGEWENKYSDLMRDFRSLPEEMPEEI